MGHRLAKCARRAGLLAIWVGSAVIQSSAADQLLPAGELARLDRESQMWREVDPRLDVVANLREWRAKGHAADEISTLAPQLAAWWELDVQRQFGWLSAETVERIRAIDEEYTARVRAARVKEHAGIGLPGYTDTSELHLRWRWNRALLRALGDDELAEFRLMNSPSARRLYERTRELKLSEGEWRTLCLWQREFDLGYGAVPAGGRATSAPIDWRGEAAWDLLERTRELLGEERFAVYLAAADPMFRRHQAALAECGAVDGKIAVELWWMRHKQREFSRNEVNGRKQSAHHEELRAAALVLMGEEALRLYVATDSGRWLAPRHRRSRVVNAQP